jgi:S1-C subfamily serine protease
MVGIKASVRLSSPDRGKREQFATFVARERVAAPAALGTAYTGSLVTEPLLLSTTRMSTFRGRQMLTAATSFFFARGERLFAVTSRHVLHDEATGHFPDRVEIVLHVDATDLTRTAVLSVLLYCEGRATWRQGVDSAGEVDVAVLELDRKALAENVVLRAFGPQHLQSDLLEVEVGAPLLVVAFPLGFYDTLHHLPVVRHAIIASSFGIRFQGQGYFLTDGRMHRGSSGAPVVMRAGEDPAMPWRLLGVHSARMDIGGRDLEQDESLGLNCAWYADILMTLTGDDPSPNHAEMGPRPGRRAHARHG